MNVDNASIDPMDMVEEFADASGFPVERISEEQSIVMVKGDWHRVHNINFAVTNDGSFLLVLRHEFEYEVSQSVATELCSFLNSFQSELNVGSVWFDFSEGHISFYYKYTVIPADDVCPTLEQIDILVQHAVTNADCALPVIVQIIAGEKAESVIAMMQRPYGHA